MATSIAQIRAEDRMTGRQVADLLGVSPRTVARMVQERTIPHYRKNPRSRPVWFLRPEIEKWLREEWKVQEVHS